MSAYVCKYALYRVIMLAALAGGVTLVRSLTEAQVVLPPNPLAPIPLSLKVVPVPRPSNLADFIVDEAAAVTLGKALFWDMQAGGDGIQACATCHFHAGADSRVKNQLNPGISNVFEVGGPNSTVGSGNFPFHRFADPDDRGSTIVFDSDDVMSSQGVFKTAFRDIVPGNAADLCDPVPD